MGSEELCGHGCVWELGGSEERQSDLFASRVRRVAARSVGSSPGSTPDQPLTSVPLSVKWESLERQPGWAARRFRGSVPGMRSEENQAQVTREPSALLATDRATNTPRFHPRQSAKLSCACGHSWCLLRPRERSQLWLFLPTNRGAKRGDSFFSKQQHRSLKRNVFLLGGVLGEEVRGSVFVWGAMFQVAEYLFM